MTSRPVKIGVMTTLWKRHDLTRIVLEYYRDLKVDGVEFVLLAAGSERGVTKKLASDCGWHHIYTPNEPLGAKHNAALKAICDLRPDCVVIIGSDDLLSATYFETCRDLFLSGVDAIKIDGIYFYHVDDDELIYHEKMDVGAGRMLSYQLCRKRNFKAWPDDRNRYLDGSMQRQIMQYATPRRIREIRDHNIAIVDIKTETNLWSREAIEESTAARYRHKIDAAELFSKHFPDVLPKLKNLKQKNREVESG